MSQDIERRRQLGGPRMTLACTAVVLSALVTAGCSSSSDDDNATAADGTKLTTITLALDYLPNPQHNGLAIAMHEGYFEKQGIKVKVLPWANSAAEPLLASGTADIGLGGNFGATILADAAGSSIKTFFNMQPVSPAVLGVLKSSGITRPAELAGKTYGGYGLPSEEQLVNDMIAADGGTGKVKQIVLNVGSYDALQSGDIDTAALYADQLYQFDQAGVDYLTWKPTDYGVPESGGDQVEATDDWLKDNADLAKRFVVALQQGQQEAIDDPEKGAADLQAEFKDIDPDLATYVSKYLAENCFPNPDGPVGTSNLDNWQAYSDYLIKNGSMVDSEGKPITSFDASTAVTNDYLPKS